MVTQNHQIISSHELRENDGKIQSRFWNQEIQELKGKFGKPKYLWYFKIAPNFTRLVAREIM